MKVLVACEFSGRVRDAFRDLGHDACSCDLLPTESPGRHIQEDVQSLLHQHWDMLVAFPPCTYLCNSGVRWLYEKDGRWEDMRRGALFFRSLLEAPTKRIAVENPIMHRHAKEVIGQDYDQIIQPYQFGHGESKATCLWLKNLPKLRPTRNVRGRKQAILGMVPSKDRAKNRSVTYSGIARAMATQWGGQV